ncbi:hypothetical protein L7F22_056947 [Adiantum nelumboides]|nr:hypothetical protein [Adiantum nelumboides]
MTWTSKVWLLVWAKYYGNELSFPTFSPDQEWLDALNTDRKRDQLDIISYEVFEVIIDRLEKEWFDLMKLMPPEPQPTTLDEDGEPVEDGNEDTACAICDDGECENSNAIVFCDGCNLAVHQDCYGIPYIPEGQWLCRKCTVSPDRAVSCILCPHEGGAFKQTTQGKWAHLLCAMWIPETGVSNPVYMEPIDSVERIPRARWKLQCYLCRHKVGACIQCDNRNCFTAFHVTCARRAGLLLRTQRQRMTHEEESDDDDEANENLRAWCHRHLPKNLRKDMTLDEVDEIDSRSDSPAKTLPPPKHLIKAAAPGTSAPGMKKSARAYKKSYRAGPPLVPAYVLNRVLEYISKVQIRKKQQFALQIAKFWSLKREARRGAPLLKRLHLEPWTASANTKEQTDAERIKKLQFLLRLREDLEKVRMLAELARKREKEKLRQVRTIRSTLVEGVLFPYYTVLRQILERVSALDRGNLFLQPVSQQKVPDYYEVIKEPMDWTAISDKLERYEYESVKDFRRDILLVLDNAMLYNKADTPFHRTALRIKKVSEPIFEELNSLHAVHQDAAQAIGTEEALDVVEGIAGLELESEEAILDLLKDYGDKELLDTIGEDDNPLDAPANVIEDLTRHYYRPEPQEPPLPSATQLKREKERAKKQAKAEAYQARRIALKEAKAAAKIEGDVNGGKEENDTLLPLHDTMPTGTRTRRQRGLGNEERQSRDREEASQPRLGRTRSRMEPGTSNKSSTEENKADAPSLPPRKRRRMKRTNDSSTPEEDRAILERRSATMPEPTNLEVEQVDAWDSFKRFNVGWVLPEGTRRSRHPRDSFRSGGAREGSMGSELAAASSAAGPERSSPQVSRGRSSEVPSQRKRRTTSITDLSEPDDAVSAEPSFSRQARKRSTSSSNSRSHPGPQFGKSSAAPRKDVSQQKRGNQGQFIRKDDDPNKERRRPSKGAALPPASSSILHQKRKAPSESTGATRLKVKPKKMATKEKEKGRFEVGTTCWAKMPGYPYYPAEIWSQEASSVPKNVEADRPKVSSESVELVRFFDAQRSFGWIGTSKLELMFEDAKLDEKMLGTDNMAGHGDRRKSSSTASKRIREEVASAYAAAKAELEV